MEDCIITEREAQQIREQLKNRRKSPGKSKLAGSSGPLARPIAPREPPPVKKAFRTFKERWLSCAGDLDTSQQLKAVEQGIEIFSLLPKESKYAQHRLKLLRKVQLLLTSTEAESTVERQAELAALLQQLQL